MRNKVGVTPSSKMLYPRSQTKNWCNMLCIALLSAIDNTDAPALIMGGFLASV